tara:strand:- start:1233 stop:1361 length:129 start_codon:yes stop_codon:yes gene_type:complete
MQMIEMGRIIKKKVLQTKDFFFLNKATFNPDYQCRLVKVYKL